MTANMYRYRLNLDGWQGAPGVTTLFFRFAAVPIIEDVQATAGLIQTAYESLKSYVVSGVRMTISNQVDVIQDSNGQLQTSAVITPPAAVIGGSTSTALSRATMAIAKFNTDSVINGRRLKGRSFIGPIGGAGIDNQGNILPTFGNAISNAYSGLLDIAGARLVVWHRPSSPGASDGDSGFVQSVSYKSVPGTLRSRRD